MEGDSFPDHEKYVFSETLTEVHTPYRLINRRAEETVPELKNGAGKDLWLFGGAVLTSSLLNAGLVDELILSVHPVLLGSGKSLLAGLSGRISLDLMRSESFSSGLVQLTYRPQSVNPAL